MAFIGIRIDVATSLQVTALRDYLRQEGIVAEWVHPADYHITVKFISGLPDDLAQKLMLGLRENLQSSTAFSLTLTEVKTFDRRGQPSVLWISVVDPESKLLNLVESVENIATPLGLAPNLEQYIPHLTIARLPKRESLGVAHFLEILAASNKELVPIDIKVRSIELIRRSRDKEKRADGPVYKSLGGIDLLT